MLGLQVRVSTVRVFRVNSVSSAGHREMGQVPLTWAKSRRDTCWKRTKCGGPNDSRAWSPGQVRVRLGLGFLGLTHYLAQRETAQVPQNLS